jgi:phosphoribosylanthranilate isomerase
MNTKSIFLPYAILMILLFTALGSSAQNKSETASALAEAEIEVIQFHSEHRCMTCNKIEHLTKVVLEGFPNIPFSLVNVDDEKNEKKAEEFEAFGTTLFLYKPGTGEKKNLTQFAFMNAGNEDKFIEELKKEIQAF